MEAAEIRLPDDRASRQHARIDLAFERELDRCVRYDLPLSVLMMDLDRLKSVNDTHGHLMGSHVLGEVGGIIRSGVRDEDVSARYGGEEFVTYLAETGGTISIGVATAPGDGPTSVTRSAGQPQHAGMAAGVGDPRRRG